MTDLLRTVATYVPQSLARAVLSDPTPRPPTKPQTQRMQAAVLFADVSGFTPLTEALSQKGIEGPEELTSILNRYFSWMIAFVEAEGGEVVKFGGDALTVIFPAADEPLAAATRRSLQAARAMQTAMDEFGIIESSVGLLSLKMKFGIGAGNVLTTQVGGLFDRWEFIVAGDALQQATEAENQAIQGEIILSSQAQAIVSPHSLPARPLPPLNWEAVQNREAVKNVLRYYIPGPVRIWLDGELHNWLATLRPMSVMFISLKGLDYEQPDTVNTLHSLLRKIQAVIYHYWGTLTRLTIDDKGTVLLVLFGAPPYSHEDDSERALRCALDLQELAKEQNMQLAIGITAERVFAGPVGGNTRREYTVMGDAVNLAARLMVAAGPSGICCNYETYRSAFNKINFEPLPPLEVKGKTEFIPIYRPIGNHRATRLIQMRRSEMGEALVGRQTELNKLIDCLNQVQAGRGRIVIIEGEAGIGKSRLIATLLEQTNSLDINLLVGMGLSIEQETAYNAWKDIMVSYFDLEEVEPEEWSRRVQAQVNQSIPEMADCFPLLNELLPLDMPENDFTASLDASLREQHLVLLVLALLETRTTKKPLMLILEDAHWFDLPSWKLAVQIAVAAINNHLPLMLTFISRPFEDVTKRTEATMLSALDETTHLRLDSLSADETLTVAAGRMGLTRNELPEAVAELVRRRAGGNPFFAEEIFYTLHDNGYITFKTMQNKIRCLISGDLDRAAQTLPATIQSVVLSRIDQLPPEKQLMLRIAAVIGHTFSYTSLYNTLTPHLDIKDQLFRDYLNDLVYLDLIRPETSDGDQIYLFKHVIIKEVAYHSLLFGRRRQLHRTVAQWYEERYQAEEDFPALGPELHQTFTITPSSPPSAVPVAPYYSLLVYHWHQAEVEERERYYASLIAQRAVAQFANAEALGYLNRALDLTPETEPAERYELLLARETVYNRYGKREAQEQDLAALAKIAEGFSDPRQQSQVALRQANYAEAVSHYADALTATEQALKHAQQIKDAAKESRAYILWGRVLLYQDELETAKEKLEQALALAQSTDSNHLQAEALTNLAGGCLLTGNYNLARQYCQQALDLKISQEHRLNKAHALNVFGVIHYHLGDYSTAQTQFEQAVSLCYAAGERRGEVKSFYNIGLIYFKQGHYEAARDYFEQTLDIQREIEDREGSADTLSNLGLVYAHFGDYNVARSYLGHSLEIRKEIGNRTGEADTLSKFSFVYHQLNDCNTTKRYCDMALDIQQEIGYTAGESYCLIYLGHALTGLDQPQAAAQAYERALKLQNKMGQAGPTIDIKAGLARIAMAQNKHRRALEWVDKILAWIETHGPTTIDDPFWVYLTCYDIFTKLGQKSPARQEQARLVLASAHNLLQEQAAFINDDMLRHNFLNNVKMHYDIITLWQNREPLPHPRKRRGKSTQSKPFTKKDGG